MKIKEIFERPIDRKIEEVIKVTQTDEKTVHEEISEYVVTDVIKGYYRNILDSIIKTKNEPHEGIGVWVSGFFGSGKSSFAKILGYILEGKEVVGKDARELFNTQANDQQIADYLDYLKKTIPVKSIIFDVSMDRGVRSASDRITEIIYKVLLRELGYSEDFDLAKLEIDLEEDGKLDEFVKIYEKEYSTPWSKGKKRASALNQASRVLSLMDSKTYNEADSWVRTLSSNGNGTGRADITPNQLAKAIFDLMGRRNLGSSAIFIVDEVGQYVSRSVDKMLDLQAFVQALGVEGKNRVNAGKATLPVWLVVTSQEKLNEIVSALDDRRIELARLRDRFPNEVDIAPTDIADVTSRRVLLKKAGVVKNLKKLFNDNEHKISQCSKLHQTSRLSHIDENSFVNLYPYLPHYIELSIDIMSGIRLLPGATRTSGGSNRTIIKQAQQMLINPKINLADGEVGELVTIDKIYDLIETNLSSEKKRDIDEIKHRFGDDEWTTKVAKAICLLEFVRDLPRSPENIAALLHPSIFSDSVLSQVKESIDKLEKAQFIKMTEEGYKLLTAQEKNWDIKRDGISIKPTNRNKIKRDAVESILTDSRITLYKNLTKTFKVSFRLDDVNIGAEGEIKFDAFSQDDASKINDSIEEKKKESREASKSNTIYYLFTLNEEIHQLIEESYKSDRMIEDHNRLAANGKLTADENKCLNDEKIRKDKVDSKLRTKFEEALHNGYIIFRGVKKDVAATGVNVVESVKNIIDGIFPDLYPKFELGAKQLTGKEPEQLLTATNLSGLASVFYEGENGLGLVTKKGNQYVIDTDTELVKEIFNQISEKHSYGDKITGKLLDEHFGGFGFGWPRDLLRVVLAGLFRAGKIEIGYQGKRYRDFSEHLGREAITNNNSYKVAVFLPREQTLSFKQIKDACENYEAITGEEVNAEEGDIARAIKKFADEKKDSVVEINAKVRANNLPVQLFVDDLLNTLKQLPENSSDDCVKFLADEGKDLKTNLDKLSKIESAIQPANLKIIKNANSVIKSIANVIHSITDADQKILDDINSLKDSIKSEDFYERLADIKKSSEAVKSYYDDIYKKEHEKRNTKFTELKSKLLSNTDFNNLPEEMKTKYLTKIDLKVCDKLNISFDGICESCSSGYTQVNSDQLAVRGLEEEINEKIKEFITQSNELIEIVKLSDYFPKSIDDIEEFKKLVNQFLNHIEELSKEGKTIVLE